MLRKPFSPNFNQLFIILQELLPLYRLPLGVSRVHAMLHVRLVKLRNLNPYTKLKLMALAIKLF